jgi:hypothetical protein
MSWKRVRERFLGGRSLLDHLDLFDRSGASPDP